MQNGWVVNVINKTGPEREVYKTFIIKAGSNTYEGLSLILSKIIEGKYHLNNTMSKVFEDFKKEIKFNNIMKKGT